MPKIRCPMICALLLSLLAVTTLAAESKPLSAPAAPRPYPKRIQWWADARFGMFVHWGPISLKGAEISWSRANSNPNCPNNGPIPVEIYDNLYQEFNPTKFNAREWVALARAAGMKYIVLTAKHCDGFLLWESEASSYNIMNTPFKRDICRELAKACHEGGMPLGWYFSPMDWRDPDCRSEHHDRFVARMQQELRELLTNYGRIDLLWFDADGRSALWNQEQTYALVRKLQPQIVINNRLDLGPGGACTGDWSFFIGPQADYYTPEQHIGVFNTQQPWESCMTLSSGNHWSWGGPGDGVKSYRDCMEMLIRAAGNDGNLLLDVGPMPTGEIPPAQVSRLREMGVWLAKNGHSIYGTRGGPFKSGIYGASTSKGNIVYLHICCWTTDPLIFPAIPAKILSGHLLDGAQVRVRQSEDHIEISVPLSERDPLDTVVALELDSPAHSLAALEPPSLLTANAKATASNVFQGRRSEYGPEKAVDGLLDTRWATDSVNSGWLELDLGRSVTFNRAVIIQAYPELERIRRFIIEYKENSHWKPCYYGGMDYESADKSFYPFACQFDHITAQFVRLNIIKATDGPTIWEFNLFQQ